MSVDAFVSRFNPLVSWLLRSPLQFLVSPGLLLLHVTGRRSGRRYSIPVGYQRDGDRLVVLASDASRKQWWRNYREPRAIELRLRGRERRGTARLVAVDSSEFRERAEQTFARMPRLGRVFGIDYDAATGLDDSSVSELSERMAIVCIESLD